MVSRLASTSSSSGSSSSSSSDSSPAPPALAGLTGGLGHDGRLVLLHGGDLDVVVVGQLLFGDQVVVVVGQLIEVSLDQFIGSFDFVEFLWHLGLSVVSWAGA